MKKNAACCLVILGLCMVGSSEAALPQANISANISGATLNVTLTPLSSDANQNGDYYLAAAMPNNIYFHNGSSWVVVDLAKTAPPSYATGTLQNKSFSADVSTMAGATIFVGYGKDFNDLVKGEKYGNALQVKSSSPSTPISNSSFVVSSKKTGTAYSASLTLLSSDQGKNGSYYVAAVVGQDVYLNDGGSWKKWDGKSLLPTFSTGSLSNKTLDFDTAGISPSQVFVGYGISQDDLLSNGKFKPV